MTTLGNANLETVHDPIAINPFLKLIGARLESAADGQALFSLEAKPELLNLHDFSHGGVIMTLLDAAMANAAVSRTGFTTVVMTINMSINFLKPGSGKLLAHARVVGGGESVSFCEGEITDESGASIAKSLGTFKHRKKKAEKAE